MGGSSFISLIIGNGLNIMEVTYKICTFITVRLSVFTLAILLMGHLLLPKERKRRNNNDTIKKEEKKEKEEMAKAAKSNKLANKKIADSQVSTP